MKYILAILLAFLALSCVPVEAADKTLSNLIMLHEAQAVRRVAYRADVVLWRAKLEDAETQAEALAASAQLQAILGQAKAEARMTAMAEWQAMQAKGQTMRDRWDAERRHQDLMNILSR